MTELSFLISLILDEELPAKHKKMCAERVKEIEAGMTYQPARTPPNPQVIHPGPPADMPPIPAVPSLAANQALQSRAEAIQAATKGRKTDLFKPHMKG